MKPFDDPLCPRCRLKALVDDMTYDQVDRAIEALLAADIIWRLSNGALDATELLDID